MIYITSDAHRDFAYLKTFVKENNLSKEDVVFVTGDAQINYFENEEDKLIKKELNELGITLIFVHGNKEKRPNRINFYRRISNQYGIFFIEEEFPNLLFAEDGQILTIEEKSFLILGGAYSVYAPGKEDGDLWWKDEQMDFSLKEKAIRELEQRNYKVDYVLSHTAPYSKIPNTGWISEIDKNILDLNFEKYLDELDKKIKYKKWFIGHYHINHVEDKYNYIFKELVPID